MVQGPKSSSQDSALGGLSSTRASCQSAAWPQGGCPLPQHRAWHCASALDTMLGVSWSPVPRLWVSASHREGNVNIKRHTLPPLQVQPLGTVFLRLIYFFAAAILVCLDFLSLSDQGALQYSVPCCQEAWPQGRCPWCHTLTSSPGKHGFQDGRVLQQGAAFSLQSGVVKKTRKCL